MSANNTIISIFDVGILSDVVYKNLRTAIFYFIWPVVISLGICINLLNIVVFLKMKSKDSVMISFLALAVSDSLYLLCAAVVECTTIIGTTGIQDYLPIYVYHLGGLILNYEGLFFDFSLGIIAYVAVVKCCCVVIALKFRSVFTVKLTIVCILIIFVIVLSFGLPIYSNTGFVWGTNPRTNISQIVGWFSKDYRAAVEFNNVVNKTVYPGIVFIVVLGCSIVLTRALVKASSLRRKMTSQVKHTNTEEENHAAHALNTRDLNVIKQVVAISICLIVTVLILAINSLAEVIVPEFNSSGRYVRLYNIIVTLGYTCTHVHAGLQLVMYYKFNSQYRRICRGILYCR